MKKYHIYNFGYELFGGIKLVPILDKEFLDDDIEVALKQALCIIIDYLKGSSLNVSNIKVAYVYNSGGKAKYIIFKNNDQMQGVFKLEEIE